MGTPITASLLHLTPCPLTPSSAPISGREGASQSQIGRDRVFLDWVTGVAGLSHRFCCLRFFTQKREARAPGKVKACPGHLWLPRSLHPSPMLVVLVFLMLFEGYPLHPREDGAYLEPSVARSGFRKHQVSWSSVLRGVGTQTACTVLVL